MVWWLIQRSSRVWLPSFGHWRVSSAGAPTRRYAKAHVQSLSAARKGRNQTWLRDQAHRREDQGQVLSSATSVAIRGFQEKTNAETGHAVSRPRRNIFLWYSACFGGLSATYTSGGCVCLRQSTVEELERDLRGPPTLRCAEQVGSCIPKKLKLSTLSFVTTTAPSNPGTLVATQSVDKGSLCLKKSSDLDCHRQTDICVLQR